MSEGDIDALDLSAVQKTPTTSPRKDLTPKIATPAVFKTAAQRLYFLPPIYLIIYGNCIYYSRDEAMTEEKVGPAPKLENITKPISNAITAPTRPASGKCFQKPSRKLSELMSSIITTNKKSTITAPM